MNRAANNCRAAPVSVVLASDDDVEGFWDAAAGLLAHGLGADAALFSVRGATADLFGAAPQQASSTPSVGGRRSAADGEEPRASDRGGRAVSSALKTMLDRVLLQSDAERFALAWRLIARSRSEPHLLALAADRDVMRARQMEKAVRRDMHKMTAFVRFREVESAAGPAFVAWFEPEHHIVAATAPFFMRRFAGMRWSILTPRRSAHWNGEELVLAEGATRADAAAGDPIEEVWRTYYAHIFNSARLKVKAMQAEMPKKYWRNLPETELIAPLVRSAAARSAAMIAAPVVVPSRVVHVARSPDHQSGASGPDAACARNAGNGSIWAGDLPALAEAVSACARCALHCDATQAVAGEGPRSARIMLVGEQPGDQEDLAGRPFVGPAGKLLDAALARAGIDRRQCYVTNAVKHFKFEPRGKTRLHKSPSRSEIDHCRWWLDRERELVSPGLIVALGASAVRGLLGESLPVSQLRGRVIALDHGAGLLTTVHPSYLLRLTDPAEKREQWRLFLDDLVLARDWSTRDATTHASGVKTEPACSAL